ncbi:glutamate racemase [Candidatus Legionella polyplacis]|uniref:Glutamate racemase n=1 Tax=Candidatus Legionella polyplacis TaxID=2005262 RepID=A0ABZ2H057_9GAMM
MKDKCSLPIGVFDSGVGGLTILRSLKKFLSNESFIYICDTARFPYGIKSRNMVHNYTIRSVNFLIKQKIKALVIACNTASSVSLPYLQSKYSHLFPVIGVIDPILNKIISVIKDNRIVILATKTTIDSTLYQRYIRKNCPHATILSKPCNVLVNLAEEGMIDNSIVREVFKYYLGDINQDDIILLGCTHFNIFKSLLKKILPRRIRVIDSSISTAFALYKVFKKNSLFNFSDILNSRIYYFVTDSIKRFQKVGKIFLGEVIKEDHVKQIKI